MIHLFVWCLCSLYFKKVNVIYKYVTLFLRDPIRNTYSQNSLEFMIILKELFKPTDQKERKVIESNIILV